MIIYKPTVFAMNTIVLIAEMQKDTISIDP